MIQRFLYRYLFKAILFLLVALVLFGVFPGTRLAVILILFVVARFIALATEALQKPIPAGINNITLRPKRELFADALGVVAFAVLIPLDVALYTRDFFSFRTPQGWEGTVVSAICVGLYVLPYRWLQTPDNSETRIWWWVLPFVLGFLALNHGIATRHPYLNPLNPNQNRLAAERVLSLKNNVVAGYHADWVLRYARQLDDQGQAQQAIHFFRETLRLDAGNREATVRLAQLEAQSGSSVENEIKPLAAVAPYWTAEKPVVKQPRRTIDQQLEEVEGCTVAVVAVGEVSDALLDTVGYVINNELKLPVYISPDATPLPAHTRKRGLATGPQWSESAIVKVFTNTIVVFPHAPIKYVVLTPADIYMSDNESFVFSTTYQWGGVVSSARFADGSARESLVRQRVAKQALCALLKSFGIRQSADRNCVTSYTRSLQEFDAKGNRPDAETMHLFQNARTALDNEWRLYKPATNLPAQ